MTFHNELTLAARLGLRWMALLLSVWMTSTAHAQPSSRVARLQPLDFREDTWAALLEKGPRPAAYVFTTTYCSTCPDVFDKLSTSVRKSRHKVELAAVVMDAQGPKALMHAHHYTGVTHLYAFDGFEPVIRKTVDPQWRNVTPYVVLVDRKGGLTRVIGPPDVAAIKAWLS